MDVVRRKRAAIAALFLLGWFWVWFWVRLLLRYLVRKIPLRNVKDVLYALVWTPDTRVFSNKKRCK